MKRSRQNDDEPQTEPATPQAGAAPSFSSHDLETLIGNADPMGQLLICLGSSRRPQIINISFIKWKTLPAIGLTMGNYKQQNKKKKT